MHPILFEIGALRIYSYGVMVALGFLAAMFFAGREARRAGIAPANMLDMGLYSLFFGIVGARVLHVLLNMGYYASRPLEAVMIGRGGLAIHGGLIAGIITACIFVKLNKMPLWKTADIIIPYVALGQAVGRVGCLLNGCCYGMATGLPFGITLPGHLQRLYPTQIISSVFMLSVFIALKRIYRKKRFDGAVFFSYLLIFSAGRFLMDFLRGDLRPVFSGLSASQLISTAMLAIALICFRIMRARAKK